MACWTLVIFSASSSGISHSNSSSSAITSSTLSSESAPRSSTKDDSFLMSASATPSCSATIFFTRASMFSTTFSSKKSAPFYHGDPLIPASPLRSILSIHVHPAVHVQRRAGDVRGCRRAQEQHRLRHVVDASQPSERHVLDQLLHLLGGERARHVRLDETGRHAVHRDVAAAHLAGERLRESGDPGLRGGVVRLAGVAGEANDRGHVHDAAR